MTEAGFNRVVAMIMPWDFWAQHQCTRPWGWNFPNGCVRCQGILDSYFEWRASLPKTRNKKQRKLDAKRVNYGSPFEPVHCCACNKRLDRLDDWTRGGSRYCGEHYRTPLQFRQSHAPDEVKRVQENIVRAFESTPLQRLQQFAADTGVPVSFEIAEKAMKGGG